MEAVFVKPPPLSYPRLQWTNSEFEVYFNGNKSWPQTYGNFIFVVALNVKRLASGS